MTNWQNVKLGNICEVTTGKRPPYKQDIETSEYNIPVYGGNGIAWYTKEILIDYPVILTGRVGTIGTIYKVQKPCWVSDNALILKPINVDFSYIYYALKLIDFTILNRGSTQPLITQTDVKNLTITIPPLEMQRRIAGVLGTLDDKIELNNKINQNLDLQAQSLFNEIYNSSENGVLSDIVDIVESGNRPKGGACPSGIPSIGAENIEKFGVYDFSKEKFISEEFFNNMKRGKVQSGDVLLYKDGAYTGKVSMALDGFPHKKCALNEHVFLLRTNDKCSQFFLYYCLSCDKNKTYLHNLACAKAAQPGLNQQELLGMPVFIPGYDKIEKFTDTVNPLMHKIAQNALENIKLSAIRDALLPKLMSGEIDVENLPPSAIIPNE